MRSVAAHSTTPLQRVFIRGRQAQYQIQVTKEIVNRPSVAYVQTLKVPRHLPILPTTTPIIVTTARCQRRSEHFVKSAKTMSWSEAFLLAVLTRMPSVPRALRHLSFGDKISRIPAFAQMNAVSTRSKLVDILVRMNAVVKEHGVVKPPRISATLRQARSLCWLRHHSVRVVTAASR